MAQVRARILQLARGRYNLQKGPTWGEERPESQIVAIGAAMDLDPECLERSLLSACL